MCLDAIVKRILGVILRRARRRSEPQNELGRMQERGPFDKAAGNSGITTTSFITPTSDPNVRAAMSDGTPTRQQTTNKCDGQLQPRSTRTARHGKANRHLRHVRKPRGISGLI